MLFPAHWGLHRVMLCIFAHCPRRRMLARAELGGNSAEETFYRLDDRGKDSLSHAEFWEVTIPRLSSRNGKAAPLSQSDVDPITV